MDILKLLVLFLFAFGGYLVVVFSDLDIANKGTPGLTLRDTFKYYWYKNAFQIFMCVSVIVIFVPLLWFGELNGFLGLFVGEMTDGKYRFTAVIVGAISSVIGIWLRKRNNPAEIKITDKEINKLNLEPKVNSNGTTESKPSED